MFVSQETWSKVPADAHEVELAGQHVQIPKSEFLVALKLHSASSPTHSKAESDWEDIRQIIRICGLDPAEPAFRELILRYGGDNALKRIEGFSRKA